jgi:hypothetical protein
MEMSDFSPIVVSLVQAYDGKDIPRCVNGNSRLTETFMTLRTSARQLIS